MTATTNEIKYFRFEARAFVDRDGTVHIASDDARFGKKRFHIRLRRKQQAARSRLTTAIRQFGEPGRR